MHQDTPRASQPRRVLALGATGGVGKALIDQAIARGHTITAFVRSPQKLTPRDGLTIVAGNPLDPRALQGVLPGHDAVLSALGPSSPWKTTIAEDGARSVVAATAGTSVRRFVVVGVAALFEDAGLSMRLIRRTFLRNVADDSARMEAIVKASDLEWTIVRPPRFTDGAVTGAYAVAVDRLPGNAGGFASIRRADVAHCLLEELERPHVQQIVGIAGP